MLTRRCRCRRSPGTFVRSGARLPRRPNAPAHAVSVEGMVRDAEILKAALARSLCHRLEGLGPVRRICMAVQDSAQVLVGDELRQLALQSQIDLAAPFPQFRIDERQAESAIDLA